MPIHFTTNCTVLNACERQPCQNGGICFLLESGYRCECPENFEGINCETRGEKKNIYYNNKLLSIICTVLNACERQPCQNGGVVRSS